MHKSAFTKVDPSAISEHERRTKVLISPNGASLMGMPSPLGMSFLGKRAPTELLDPQATLKKKLLFSSINPSMIKQELKTGSQSAFVGSLQNSGQKMSTQETMSDVTHGPTRSIIGS